MLTSCVFWFANLEVSYPAHNPDYPLRIQGPYSWRQGRRRVAYPADMISAPGLSSEKEELAFPGVSSPWYNRHCWLGDKNQLSIYLGVSVCRYSMVVVTAVRIPIVVTKSTNKRYSISLEDNIDQGICGITFYQKSLFLTRCGYGSVYVKFDDSPTIYLYDHC